MSAEYPTLDDGRCRSEDPDMWIEDSPGYRQYAIHTCLHHCPALTECLRDANENQAYVAGTIRAGLLWVSAGRDRAQPAKAQPREGTCKTCSPRLPRYKEPAPVRGLLGIAC